VRIAIVSDTHLPRGSRTLPRPCVERLLDADAILHCGDFMTADVLDWFERLGPPVHAVSGNVDDTRLQDRLPERHVAELGGARIGMVHVPGPKAGRVERLRRLFPDTAAVVFGHTHLPEHADTGDGFQVFNPGSPTERRRAPARTMGMATIDGDGHLEFELIAVG
jgi:putative phosphoesterase